MRDPPPSEYLTWPKPNYNNPETKGASLLVVCITLIIIAFIVVLMRLYVRWHILHNVGVDDWLMVLSMVSKWQSHSCKLLDFVNVFFKIPAIGLTISTLTATHYGWGTHIWDVEPSNSSSSVKVELPIRLRDSYFSNTTFVLNRSAGLTSLFLYLL